MDDFEMHLPGPTLVLAFAGGPQNRFQFGRVLRDLRVPHILFRDSSQRHYVDGVSGFATRKDFQQTLQFIQFDHTFEKIIAVGVSSGAYAALMYGSLVGSVITHVIAISPITGRSESTAADFDPKYRQQIIDPKQPDLDLKPMYARRTGNRYPRVQAFISDGPGCELDRGMCERIGVMDITLVPGYAHGDLGRGMRDLGMFKELFK